jgi:cell division protein FtsL
MALVVFISAMAVVFVRSANRQSFLALQTATLERDHLSEEWGRLQLEHATWSSHNLVEHEARQKLQMITPGLEDVVVLRLAPGS